MSAEVQSARERERAAQPADADWSSPPPPPVIPSLSSCLPSHSRHYSSREAYSNTHTPSHKPHPHTTSTPQRETEAFACLPVQRYHWHCSKPRDNRTQRGSIIQSSSRHRSSNGASGKGLKSFPQSTQERVAGAAAEEEGPLHLLIQLLYLPPPPP